MNKSFIFGIASTLAVVALAGGGYWLGKSNSNPQSSALVASEASHAEVVEENHNTPADEIKGLGGKVNLPTPSKQQVLQDFLSNTGTINKDTFYLDYAVNDYQRGEFWLGTPFSVQKQRFYLGVIAALSSAEGEAGNVRLYPIVYREEQGKWKITLKSTFGKSGYLSEDFERLGKAPSLSSQLHPLTHPAGKNKTVIAIPTERSEIGGVLMTVYQIYAYDQQTNALDAYGNIQTAEDATASCTDNQESSCQTNYTGSLSFADNPKGEMPIIKVKRKGYGVTRATGEVGKLSRQDDFEYHYDKSLSDQYFEIHSAG